MLISWFFGSGAFFVSMILLTMRLFLGMGALTVKWILFPFWFPLALALVSVICGLGIILPIMLLDLAVELFFAANEFMFGGGIVFISVLATFAAILIYLISGRGDK